jgi:hypothetical protein
LAIRLLADFEPFLRRRTFSATASIIGQKYDANKH